MGVGWINQFQGRKQSMIHEISRCLRSHITFKMSRATKHSLTIEPEVLGLIPGPATYRIYSAIRRGFPCLE